MIISCTNFRRCNASVVKSKLRRWGRFGSTSSLKSIGSVRLEESQVAAWFDLADGADGGPMGPMVNFRISIRFPKKNKETLVTFH